MSETNGDLQANQTDYTAMQRNYYDQRATSLTDAQVLVHPDRLAANHATLDAVTRAAGDAVVLEAGGFAVVDLGTNVSTEKFAQAIRDHHPAVLGLSALLTTTMRQMRETLQELRRLGVMDGVKTVIGGAPVTREFAVSIGADGYGSDAPAAVAEIRRLLGALPA